MRKINFFDCLRSSIVRSSFSLLIGSCSQSMKVSLVFFNFVFLLPHPPGGCVHPPITHVLKSKSSPSYTCAGVVRVREGSSQQLPSIDLRTRHDTQRNTTTSDGWTQQSPVRTLCSPMGLAATRIFVRFTRLTFSSSSFSFSSPFLLFY